MPLTVSHSEDFDNGGETANLTAIGIMFVVEKRLGNYLALRPLDAFDDEVSLQPDKSDPWVFLIVTSRADGSGVFRSCIEEDDVADLAEMFDQMLLALQKRQQHDESAAA